MKKCVIIGGGPAGLTAGYELLKNSKDYEVVILEQSDTLGGISRTVKYNGNRMDIGGHRFFSKDKQVTDFWSELMPTQGAPSIDDKILGREKALVPGGPDPEKEDRVMLIRRRISRIYYLHKFFDYPITMKPQTFINMGFTRTVKAGCSYLKSTVSKKEETSLENFYINRFGKVLYSMFFEGYTEKLWGRHPSEISADWGAQRVKGLSILAVIKDMLSKLVPNKNRKVETSLIEEFVYPKLGPGQFWETVGEEFEKMGGKILYGHKVTEINTADGRVTSVKSVCGDKEEIFDGDIFFSSMPVKDLVAGMGSAVPAAPAEIAAGLPYRDFVTVGLLVDKLDLKNETGIKTLNNIVPDCWIYVQDVGVTRTCAWDAYRSSTTGRPTLSRIRSIPCGSALSISATRATTFGAWTKKPASIRRSPSLSAWALSIRIPRSSTATVSGCRRLTPLISTPMTGWTSWLNTSIHLRISTASAETASTDTTIWITPWPLRLKPSPISSATKRPRRIFGA